MFGQLFGKEYRAKPTVMMILER